MLSLLLHHYVPFPSKPSASSGLPASVSSSQTPTRSISSFSYHHFTTHDPGRRSASRNRSRIGLVAMNFATVLFLLEVYVSISSKPDSRIASSNRGYFHIPSDRCFGWFPVVRLKTDVGTPLGPSLFRRTPPVSSSRKSILSALGQLETPQCPRVCSLPLQDPQKPCPDSPRLPYVANKFRTVVVHRF